MIRMLRRIFWHTLAIVSGWSALISITNVPQVSQENVPVLVFFSAFMVVATFAYLLKARSIA